MAVWQAGSYPRVAVFIGGLAATAFLLNLSGTAVMAGVRRIRQLLAVSILGAFVYLCGALILVGSIAMTKLQRVYEAAILKALGARRATIFKIAIVEYSILGLLAGMIGSSAAIVVTWAMTEYGRMRVPWHLRPSINVLGVVATVVLATVVGVLASWGVVSRKPLRILREQ